MRDDGVCWIDIGDSYAGGGSGQNGWRGNGLVWTRSDPRGAGFEPGNLAGVPERLVLALQADGWVWRSTVVWDKDAAMPESVAGWYWSQHRVKTGKTRWVGDSGKNNAPESVFDGLATVWKPCPGCPKCSPNDGLILRQGSWRPTRSHEGVMVRR